MLITFFFFFHATATTEIYTLSLHDALPICLGLHVPGVKVGGPAAQPDQDGGARHTPARRCGGTGAVGPRIDRKSTRLNSSHEWISYAVFCLKKKKKKNNKN